MTNPTPPSTAIQWGALLGVGVVAYFLLFYAMGREVMLHPAVWWSSVLGYLYVMYRQMVALGPTVDFKARLQAGFVIFMVANAVFFLFYHLLFAVFDPQLVALQEQMLLASPLYEGKPEELDLTPTPGVSFLRYCTSLIGGFVLAFGMAYIINRSI